MLLWSSNHLVFKEENLNLQLSNPSIKSRSPSVLGARFSQNKSLKLNVKINHAIKLNIFHFEEQVFALPFLTLLFIRSHSQFLWLLISFYSSLGFNDVFMNILFVFFGFYSHRSSTSLLNVIQWQKKIFNEIWDSILLNVEH